MMSVHENPKKKTPKPPGKPTRKRAGRKPLPPGVGLIPISSNVKPSVKTFYYGVAARLEEILKREISVAAVTAEALEHAMSFISRRYGVEYDPTTDSVRIAAGADKAHRDPQTGQLLRVPKLQADGETASSRGHTRTSE